MAPFGLRFSEQLWGIVAQFEAGRRLLLDQLLVAERLLWGEPRLFGLILLLCKGSHLSSPTFSLAEAA
jgi:hypothetical protein